MLLEQLLQQLEQLKESLYLMEQIQLKETLILLGMVLKLMLRMLKVI